MEDLEIDIDVYKRKAAGKLLSLRYLKDEYHRIASDVAYASCKDNHGIRAGTSDPTASMAIRLDHRAGDLIHWISACEIVYSMCGDKKRFLINARINHIPESQGGRPGWVRHVQKEFEREFNWMPSERALKSMWQEVINNLVIIAMAKKIL